MTMFRPLSCLMLIVLSILLCPSLQADYPKNDVSFNTGVAFHMLRASSASYCPDTALDKMKCGEICDDLDGYTFVRQYNLKTLDGDDLSFSTFVNPSEKIFLTAFRGTQGVYQLIHEIKQSTAITYDLYPIDNAVAGDYFYSRYINYLRMAFQISTKNAKAMYPDYEYYITGHSLGGAFATLAALDASLGGLVSSENLHLFTFGSPRVGDFNLAKAVVDNVNEMYRITHDRDIVPHLPPCTLGLDLECQSDPDHADENGAHYWHAWHVWPEIFYIGNTNADFKLCYDGEDPYCADQFTDVGDSVADHLMYLGLSTGCTSPTDSEEKEEEDSGAGDFSNGGSEEDNFSGNGSGGSFGQEEEDNFSGNGSGGSWGQEEEESFHQFPNATKSSSGEEEEFSSGGAEASFGEEEENGNEEEQGEENNGGEEEENNGGEEENNGGGEEENNGGEEEENNGGEEENNGDGREEEESNGGEEENNGGGEEEDNS